MTRGVLPLLFAAAALVSTASAAPPQAPAIPPQAPPIPRAEPTYADLRARAIREGRPLIVWVGVDAESEPLAAQLPTCLHYHCQAFWGASPRSVVVGVPSGSDLHRHDMPGQSVEAIRRLIAPAPVAAPVYQFTAPPVYAAPAWCPPGGS